MSERWSLAAGHIPDALAIGVVVIGAVLAAAEGIYAFSRPRTRTSRRVAIAILALRFLAVAAVLGIAFEITLRVEQVGPKGRRVVVLVDRSASMALPDAAGTGRDDADPAVAGPGAGGARSEEARSRWRDDGLIVDVRGFDSETTPMAGEFADTLVGEPTGAASDLARALTELGEPDPRRQAPLVGVVVVSDGLVATDGASEKHVRAVAEGLGVPVTTVSVGAPALRDVSVAAVRAGEFAFVENVTEIETTLVAHGLRGKVTEVPPRAAAQRRGRCIANPHRPLLADGVPLTVRFEVAPGPHRASSCTRSWSTSCRERSHRPRTTAERSS